MEDEELIKLYNELSETGLWVDWILSENKRKIVHFETRFETDSVEKSENKITVHLKNDSGTTAIYEITENGRKRHFKDSEGNEFWDELNDSLKKSIHYKQSNGFESWNEYDEHGNVLHYKDVMDNILNEHWYKYDEKNNEIYYRDSKGLEQWQEYNSENLLIHFKDSTGFEEYYRYDEYGNQIKLEKNIMINNELNERIERAFEIAKKYTEIRSPINPDVGFTKAEKGSYIKDVIDSAEKYYAKHPNDFAMPLQDLSALIKGSDAVSYGADSLDFIRPSVQQMEDGIAEGWDFDKIKKGYGFFTAPGLPEGVEIVSKIDDMATFESDLQASQQARKDGISFIKSIDYKFLYEPDSILNRCSSIIIDTEENRKLLKDYLIPENAKNNINLLNELLLGINENEVFSEDFVSEDSYTYIEFINYNFLDKDNKNKLFTKEELASILLQNSFIQAGLDSYPETWKKLLANADNISDAVYAAAADAYLGDNLRFLIENATEEQWNKVKSDRNASMDILRQAESSIMNDHVFTVNPTLEIAEKLGLQKAAVHYVNSLINDYQITFSHDENFQNMCSNLETYCARKNLNSFYSLSRNHYNLPEEIELTKKELENNNYYSEESKEDDEKHLRLVTGVLNSINEKLNYELTKEYSLQEKNRPYYTVETGLVTGKNEIAFIPYDENNFERLLGEHFESKAECQTFCEKKNYETLKAEIKPRYVDIVELSSADNSSSYRYDIKIPKDDRFFKEQLHITNDTEYWKNENDYVSLVIDINEKSTSEDIKIDLSYIRIDDSSKTEAEDFLTEIEINLNENLKNELCEVLKPLVLEKIQEHNKNKELSWTELNNLIADDRNFESHKKDVLESNEKNHMENDERTLKEDAVARYFEEFLDLHNLDDFLEGDDEQTLDFESRMSETKWSILDELAEETVRGKFHHWDEIQNALNEKLSSDKLFIEIATKGFISVEPEVYTPHDLYSNKDFVNNSLNYISSASFVELVAYSKINKEEMAEKFALLLNRKDSLENRHSKRMFCGAYILTELDKGSSYDEIMNNENPGFPFNNDREKMRDFKEMTKEDFLKFYSYLNESDYAVTKEVFNKSQVCTDVTFPCGFYIPEHLETSEEQNKFMDNLLASLKEKFNFGNSEYEQEYFPKDTTAPASFNVNFSLSVPTEYRYPVEKTDEWVKEIEKTLEKEFEAYVNWMGGERGVVQFESPYECKEYVKFKAGIEEKTYMNDTNILKDMYSLSQDEFIRKHDKWDREDYNKARMNIYESLDKEFKESTFYREIFQTKDRGSEYALDLEMPYLNDSPESSIMRIFSSAEVKKGDELKMDMEFDNLGKLKNIHVLHEREGETLCDHSINLKNAMENLGFDFKARCDELVKLNLFEFHNNMSLKETYFLTPKAYSSFNNYGEINIQEFQDFFNSNKTDSKEPSLTYSQAEAVMDFLSVGEYGIYTDEKGNVYIYDKADDSWTGEGSPVGNKEIIDYAMIYAEKEMQDGVIKPEIYELVKEIHDTYKNIEKDAEIEEEPLSYAESEDFIKDFILEAKYELQNCKNNPISAMSKVINSWEKNSEKRKVIDSYLRGLDSEEKFIKFAKEIVSEKEIQQHKEDRQKKTIRTSKDDDFGRS